MAWAAGLVGVPSFTPSWCPGQTPAWKILCSGSGLTGNGVKRGTTTRTVYKAVLRTICSCHGQVTSASVHAPMCVLLLAVPENPKSIHSHAYSRTAHLQVPLGTSFRKALVTCKDRVLPPSQMETDSHVSVMLWPLAREVGQNTHVGPAQAFIANDGAERSQSCFLLLVFLASLRSKRGRKGCFQHREQRWVMESFPCIS